jgi:hypothetical protein
MKVEDFDTLHYEMYRACKKEMDKKRPGYTLGSDDALANFKRVAALAQNQPHDQVITNMAKHWDSILSFINHPELEVSEEIVGRFVDLTNYVTILFAILVEDGRIDAAKIKLPPLGEQVDIEVHLAQALNRRNSV